MESYLRTTAPLDAIHYISHAAPSAVLFQFAERDAFISQPAALKYVQAASEPKLVRWYSAQHQDIFKEAEAIHDRIEWLRREIQLGFPEREA